MFDTRVIELRDNSGRDNRVHFILGVVLRVFENIERVEYIRFIGNRAERTLIHARAATDALVVVYNRFFIGVDLDCIGFTAQNARTLLQNYGIVRTSLRASSALYALFLIDDGVLAFYLNSLFGANLDTAVRNAPPARGRDENAVHGTLVARYVNDFDDVLIVLVAAHCEL